MLDAMGWPGGERLAAFFGAGGPVVILLCALSVIAVTVIGVKLWQFRALRATDRSGVEAALDHSRRGELQQAIACVADRRNPTAQAVARGLRGVQGGLPEAQIREEVLRYGRSILESLRNGLRPLEVIGTLAPLLGLFGTVLGMIEAFRNLEQAGNQVNPAVLSGGIWEALLTTAVGLAVAIPVVAAVNWLERRVEALAHRIDDAVSRIFTRDLSEPVAEPEEPSREHARLRSATGAGRGPARQAAAD
ncbi:MAG: MotA/TolQ/ExbB proton channel family protein [Ectothiorhodospiraceae bacterium]